MRRLRHSNRMQIHLLGAALLLGAVACGGESSNENVKSAPATTAAVSAPPSSSTPTQVLGPAVSTVSTGGASASTSTIRGSEASSLSDPQIAELAGAVNGGEL